MLEGDDEAPRGRPPARERAGVEDRLAAGYALAGLLFVGLAVLFDAPLWLAAVGLAASASLAAGASTRRGGLTWVGLVGLAAVSLGTHLTGPIGVEVLVFGLVGTALFVLALTALGEADGEPLVRAQLATRGHLWRWTGLACLWLALVGLPVVFEPVRIALASEMGTTLAVLLLAGATVLVFALPLAALDEERRRTTADELRDRDVRFGVHAIRYPGDD